MTLREQDAYIATHLFHLDVLGWANADNYDSCGWEGWTVHAKSNWTINQPVFLMECVCDILAESDARINAELGIDYIEPKIFGHCSICLRVVPFYSESLVDAFAMESKIAELDLESVYSRKLLDITIGTAEHVLDWTDMNDIFSVIHATPAQRAQAAVEMLMARAGEGK